LLLGRGLTAGAFLAECGARRGAGQRARRPRKSIARSITPPHQRCTRPCAKGPKPRPSARQSAGLIGVDRDSPAEEDVIRSPTRVSPRHAVPRAGGRTHEYGSAAGPTRRPNATPSGPGRRPKVSSSTTLVSRGAAVAWEPHRCGRRPATASADRSQAPYLAPGERKSASASTAKLNVLVTTRDTRESALWAARLQAIAASRLPQTQINSEQPVGQKKADPPIVAVLFLW